MRAGLLGLDRGRGQSGVGYPQAADRNPRPASPAKLPLVIHTRGGDHKVSTSLGRILCGRGIDTTVGTTEVEACDGKSEADCFALKRQGGPLNARINLSEPRCDTPCVLFLAGGVHRSLPPGTRIMLTGRFIRSRLAPNMSDEAREGLKARHDELFRLYLREMGVEPELLDFADQNWEPSEKRNCRRLNGPGCGS